MFTNCTGYRVFHSSLTLYFGILRHYQDRLVVFVLLPSALARGSESRVYSHKVRVYIRAYVRGGSCSGMSRGISLHTIGIGIGHMCVTQSDTFRLRLWMTACFGNGGGGWGRRHSGAITAWILQPPNSFSYSKRITCHAHLTCTRVYDACA